MKKVIYPVREIILGFIILVAFAFPQTSQAEVEFGSEISATPFQIGTMIKWNTLSEINSHVFIIERSKDGRSFEAIGEVPGSGDSYGFNEYSFLDVHGSSNMNYYRLTQKEFDGDRHISSVVAVKSKDQSPVTVLNMRGLENSQSFDLTLHSEEAANVQLSIQNWEGKEMETTEVELISGINNIQVPMSCFQKGLYKIEMTVDSIIQIFTLDKNSDNKSIRRGVAAAE